MEGGLLYMEISLWLMIPIFIFSGIGMFVALLLCWVWYLDNKGEIE